MFIYSVLAIFVPLFIVFKPFEAMSKLLEINVQTASKRLYFPKNKDI